MRVKHHLLQSFFISLILIFSGVVLVANIPLLKSNLLATGFFVIAPLFLFFGTLYLDVDITGPWKLKFRNRKNYNIITDIWDGICWFFKLGLIIIAYFFRWIIYYPSFWICKQILPKKYSNKITDNHRQFTHTLIGILVSAIFVFILLNLVGYILDKHNYSYLIFKTNLLLALFLSVGFLIGEILHLLQDAYSGNNNEDYALIPLFPFNSQIKIYGNYNSWDKNNNYDKIMSLILFFILGFLTYIAYKFIYTINSKTTGVILFYGFILSILLLIYCSFGIIYNVILKIKDKKIYLKNTLIKIIVGIIIINLLIYILFL